MSYICPVTLQEQPATKTITVHKLQVQVTKTVENATFDRYTNALPFTVTPRGTKALKEHHIGNPAINIRGPIDAFVMFFPEPPFFMVEPGNPNKFDDENNREALAGGPIVIRAGPCRAEVKIQVLNSPPFLIDASDIENLTVKSDSLVFRIIAADPESTVNIKFSTNTENLQNAYELLKAIHDILSLLLGGAAPPLPSADALTVNVQLGEKVKNFDKSVTQKGIIKVGGGVFALSKGVIAAQTLGMLTGVSVTGTIIVTITAADGATGPVIKAYPFRIESN